MRALIFIAGFLLAGLGFLAFQQTKDPSTLQGGLTLGGGLVICGIFSIKSKWHGFVGAAVLAFLGAMRTVPSLASLAGGADADTAFKASAGVICLIVFIVIMRALLAERRRKSIEDLKAGRG